MGGGLGLGCGGGAEYRGEPNAVDAPCAARLLALTVTFLGGSGGRTCCVLKPKPGTLEAFWPALLLPAGFGGSGSLGGGGAYCRGVPKADDCCCAALLAGVGGGGARLGCGDGARGVLAPKTDDCCWPSLLLGLPAAGLPAAGGGGAYSRGVPNALPVERCCSLVLVGGGGGVGFGGFGGTGKSVPGIAVDFSGRRPRPPMDLLL